jgi:uncharacterized protein (DUF1501 family)
MNQTGLIPTGVRTTIAVWCSFSEGAAMLTIREKGIRLCDGLTRRDVLHAGGLGLLGLSLPELLRVRAQAAGTAGRGSRAKSCIVLFLMGGPPQHSTWDPKPDAPEQIRGQFKPIPTTVPGMQVGELLPRMARLADKLCLLRAVSTDDNAHSSSGYFMMTGYPHQPTNFENANPGPPNNWPTLGAYVQRLRRAPGTTLPAAVRLPHRIFNTDGSVWPGQDAGLLGHSADPWLLRCEPGAAKYSIPEFSLAADVPPDRLQGRHDLLARVNQRFEAAERSGAPGDYDAQTQQAFDLLRSARSRNAFDLHREPERVRERYGGSPFGQSVLLARRLVDAGVSLVQVNWFRGPNEPSDNPCWDSHTNEAERLKKVLLPPTDQAFSALLEDLSARGMLDETLVVCMAEFGRTPKFNPRAGRDHWGHVFSVALAGGGIRGGQVYGASDKVGGYPKDGKVPPQDLLATIFHCLGHHPDTEVHDTLGRPLPLSRGQVIRQIV